MGQLFDRPMNELREAFVRARFTEDNIFGRPDIEAWATAPGFATIPFNKAPALLRYFLNLWEETNLSWVLRTKATPLEEPPWWLLWHLEKRGFETTEPFTEIITTLQRGGAKVYYPWHNSIGLSPVILIDNSLYGLQLPSDNLHPIVALRPCDVRDVLEILNGEAGDRPKRTEVSAFFRDEAHKAISQEREIAQHDFDEAVATSADGTKIVKAKWVCVIAEGYRHATLYPANNFLASKIRIFSPHQRYSTGIRGPYELDAFIRQFITVARNSTGGATHLISDPRGHIPELESLYVVDTNIDPQRLPSPIPDGGREIRIRG